MNANKKERIEIASFLENNCYVEQPEEEQPEEETTRTHQKNKQKPHSYFYVIW